LGNKIPLSNTLYNKMIMNNNMLAVIMLNRIYSHVGVTDVVTAEPSRGGDGNINIMEKFLNPDGFSNSVSDSSIFSFSRRLGDRKLLLGMLGNEIWAKEHCVVRSRSTRILAPGPISVRAGHNDR